MYEYKAQLHNVVDGDTVDLKVDLGFKTFIIERFRLLGFDAPEMKTPQGQPAKNHLQSLLEKHTLSLVIKSEKRDGFRRWLGTLYVNDGTVLHNVNAVMAEYVKSLEEVKA